MFTDCSLAEPHRLVLIEALLDDCDVPAVHARLLAAAVPPEQLPTPEAIAAFREDAEFRAFAKAAVKWRQAASERRALWQAFAGGHQTLEAAADLLLFTVMEALRKKLEQRRSKCDLLRAATVVAALKRAVSAGRRSRAMARMRAKLPRLRRLLDQGAAAAEVMGELERILGLPTAQPDPSTPVPE